ncbi:hypothetical protein IFM89_005853 [Coptis chinensis]|uniref:Uncharacterized protein n=1 Tax=Coptis chinensis TaxID=261450 RepID=A0A835HL41_9MAGN|nr:hypothetical protein IFM89_005853 [Coptis chinensis]
MYVHIATFLLFCLAPFWIFNLAAVNIDNEVVREALGLIGVVLCVFGSIPSKPGMINSPSPSRFSKGYDSPDRQLPIVMEESSVRGNNNILTPPAPSLIQREDV